MHQRRNTIIERLREQPEVYLRELASEFNVSEMTIRRDLIALQRQGLVIRTHGGGVAVTKVRLWNNPLQSVSSTPAKHTIGLAAAQLVSPHQTVMIDTGTTPLEVARHLPLDFDLTVATTSLYVVQEHYGSSLNLLLMGGYIRKEFPSTFGPMTENALRNLHADILFMGCDGASSVDGFYTADIHVGSLEQAMIDIADRVVVVTESKKFTRRALMRYADLSKVHTVVTDSALSDKDRTNLEAQGIEVILANNE